jgi:hypothetical protein
MPRHRDLDANGSGSYRIPHAPRHREPDPVTYLERLRAADAVIHPNEQPDVARDIERFRDADAEFSRHIDAIPDLNGPITLFYGTPRNGSTIGIPLSELERFEPLRGTVQAAFAAELDRYVDPDTGNLFRLP